MNRFRILPAALPFLLLTVAPASAQVGIAVTSGINIGYWTTDLYRFAGQDFTTVTRPSAALTASIPVTETFAMSLRGSMSGKGGGLDIPAEDGQPQVSVSFEPSYFEFTLLGRVNLPLVEDRLLAFAVVGPTWAWMVSCRFRTTWRDLPRPDPVEDEEDCPDGSEDQPVDVRILARDFGLSHGGGLEVGLTETLGATVGVSFMRGRRNLWVEESPRDPRRDYLRIRTVTFRGGVVYRIG